MQDDLLAEFRNHEFQRKLHSVWQAAGHDEDRQRAKKDVCLEAQAKVLPRYGFEASERGAMLSDAAFALTERSYFENLVIIERNEWLWWLVNPDVQALHPHGPPSTPVRIPSVNVTTPTEVWRRLVLAHVPCREKVMVSIRVVSGLSGDLQCLVEVCYSDRVFELKRAISSKLRTPEREYLLQLDGKLLRDHDVVGVVVHSFMLQQEPDSHHNFTADPVDVTLVRIDPERASELDSVRQGLVRITDLPREKLADQQLLLVAIHQSDHVLARVDAELRRSRDFILAAMRESGTALQFVGEELRDDREVVLIAVASNGLALQFASDRLRGDREVVMTAVWNAGSALQYASDDLHRDREIVLNAVRSSGMMLRHADAALRADREVVVLAVWSTGRALEFANLALRKDKEIINAALKRERRPALGTTR